MSRNEIPARNPLFSQLPQTDIEIANDIRRGWFLSVPPYVGLCAFDWIMVASDADNVALSESDLLRLRPCAASSVIGRPFSIASGKSSNWVRSMISCAAMVEEEIRLLWVEYDSGGRGPGKAGLELFAAVLFCPKGAGEGLGRYFPLTMWLGAFDKGPSSLSPELTPEV